MCCPFLIKIPPLDLHDHAVSASITHFNFRATDDAFHLCCAKRAVGMGFNKRYGVCNRPAKNNRHTIDSEHARDIFDRAARLVIPAHHNVEENEVHVVPIRAAALDFGAISFAKQFNRCCAEILFENFFRFRCFEQFFEPMQQVRGKLCFVGASVD